MGSQGFLTPLSCVPDFARMCFWGWGCHSVHWISKRGHDPQALVQPPHFTEGQTEAQGRVLTGSEFQSRLRQSKLLDLGAWVPASGEG